MMKRYIALAFTLLVVAGCGKVPYQWAYKVPTAAMEPTIKQGESIIAEQNYYETHPIQRFDIVVLIAPQSDAPDAKTAKLVKRVVALSGEEVSLRNGEIFIDSQRLDEPFAVVPSGDDFGPIKVPAQEYFVLGDNRPNSDDSRYWHPATIKQSDIYGKVIKVIKDIPK